MLLNTTMSGANDIPPDLILNKGDCVGDVVVAMSPKAYLITTNEIKACEKLKGKNIELELENRFIKAEENCPSCTWEMAKSSGVALLLGFAIGFFSK